MKDWANCLEQKSSPKRHLVGGSEVYSSPKEPVTRPPLERQHLENDNSCGFAISESRQDTISLMWAYFQCTTASVRQWQQRA